MEVILQEAHQAMDAGARYTRTTGRFSHTGKSLLHQQLQMYVQTVIDALFQDGDDRPGWRQVEQSIRAIHEKLYNCDRMYDLIQANTRLLHELSGVCLGLIGQTTDGQQELSEEAKLLRLFQPNRMDADKLRSVEVNLARVRDASQADEAPQAEQKKASEASSRPTVATLVDPTLMGAYCEGLMEYVRTTEAAHELVSRLRH